MKIVDVILEHQFRHNQIKETHKISPIPIPPPSDSNAHLSGRGWGLPTPPLSQRVAAVCIRGRIWMGTLGLQVPCKQRRVGLLLVILAGPCVRSSLHTTVLLSYGYLEWEISVSLICFVFPHMSTLSRYL